MWNIFRKSKKQNSIESLLDKYDVVTVQFANGQYDWSTIIFHNKSIDKFSEKLIFTRYPLDKGILKTINVNKLLDALVVDSLDDAKIIYDFYKKNLGDAVDGIVFSSAVTGINDRLLEKCTK